MKFSHFILILLTSSGNLLYAQSTTTQQLHKKHVDAFYLYFYKNTLQMINQDNNEEFAKLIDNIDKMKFLRIDKKKEELDVRALIVQYQEEAFEELMSMREEDKDIKVFIKERNKVTLGLVMLINDQDALSILDIKGSVPLDQLVSLYDKVRMIN
jgi:hypothetical protein